MNNEPRAVREIHDIRLQIYEETKGMTPEEHTAYFRKSAQEMIDKHGLKVKRPDPPAYRKIV